MNLIKNIDADGIIISALGDDVDFVSRYFAPQSGINEDFVTGSAHTTLTPIWSKKIGKNILTAQQLSRRKGELTCEVKGIYEKGIKEEDKYKIIKFAFKHVTKKLVSHKNMKKILLVLGLIIALAFQNVEAQTTLRTQHFNLEKSVAIQGYDPVAYFVQNKAVEGSESITTKFKGVTYRFVNAKNRKTFLESPKKFEPQYGGWCAYAMGSAGEKVNIDPDTFKIINEQLYLFYNSFFNNILKDWDKEEKILKKKADENWKNIYK